MEMHRIKIQKINVDAFSNKKIKLKSNDITIR